MMRTLLVAVALCSTPAIALFAQHHWIPGLDFMIPVYQEEKDGIPGPLSHILGYDRDTGVASLLDIKAECYISWWWRPTRGEGGITRIVQVNARTYALYHESGYLRLEPQPDAWFCTPTIPPK